MAKEAKNIITTAADEECVLQDQLLPKHAAQQLAMQLDGRKPDGGGKRSKKERQAAAAAAAAASHPQPLPGHESYRRTREELTT